MRVLTRFSLWVGLVVVSAGLAFGTLTFVFFNTRLVVPDDLGDGYLVVANAFLILALLITLFVYADNRRLRLRHVARIEEKTVRILRHLDSIFHTRTGLSSYLLKHRDDPTKLDACVEESSAFLRFLVEETRSMFDDFTSHSCAVSIKLLVPSSSGTPAVRTFLRDKRSGLSRTEFYVPTNGIYPYDDHSPFVEIVSGQTSGDYFICNDLRAAAARGAYKNGNPHWSRFYNSTLIVPIKEPSAIAGDSILGFLCIDSGQAKFDESISVYMARIISNTIFYVIYTLSVLERRKVPLSESETQTKRAADA